MSSQNLSSDSIKISVAQMDTISVRLLQLETCQQFSSLMQMNVNDLKLAKVKQDTLIMALQVQNIEKDKIITLKDSIIAKKDVILNATEDSCKVEKRGIRKRLLLIGGSTTLSGLILGLAWGLLSN